MSKSLDEYQAWHFDVRDLSPNCSQRLSADNTGTGKELTIMHQSFVSTAPPPTGMVGIVTFHFSEPWYKPRPVETS